MEYHGQSGVEYQIGHGQGFITIFAEIKKALSAGTSSYQEEFVNSSFKFHQVNMGISIEINPYCYHFFKTRTFQILYNIIQL